MTFLSNNKNALSLAIVLIFIILIIAVTSFHQIYTASIETTKKSLTNLVLHEKDFIDNLNSLNFPPDSIKSIYINTKRNFSTSDLLTELVIAVFENDSAEYIVRADLDRFESMKLPVDKIIAAPMKKAFFRETGTIIGKDYSNRDVISAYTYSNIPNWGIVAKIDLDELRKPYINAGLISFLLSVFLISIALYLYSRITNPLIESEKHNREFLNAIFDRSSDAILVLDSKCTIVDFNKLFLSKLNYTKESLSGKPIELFIKDDKKICLTYGLFNITFLAAEGKEVEFECVSSEININKKQFIILNLRDLTLIKDIRAKLQNKEVEFKSYFENSMDAVMITSTDGSIISVNPAACQIFKMSENEIISKCISDLIDKKDLRTADYFEERRRQRKAFGELRFVKSDGTIFDAEVSSAVYFDSNNNERTNLIIHDITNRIELLKLLTESEYKFRSALSNSHVTVFSQDESLKYTWIYNPPVFFRVSDIIGKTDFELLKYKDAKKLIGFKQNVLKNGISQKDIFRLNFGDNDYYFEITAIPRKDNSNRIVGIFCTAVDITGLKLSEIRLEESEGRFRALLESSNSLIWETDRDGVYTFISPHVERFLGYQCDYVLGKSPFYFSPESDRESNIKDSEIIVKTQKPFYNYMNRMLHSNGKIIICETSGVPIFDQESILIGYRGLTTDVTEREEAVEKLIESESRFRSMFHNSLSVMFVIDPENGQIVDVNNAAVDFYGWSRDEMLSMNIAEINTLSLEEVKSAMDKAKAQSQVYFEFKHKKANGTISDVEVFTSKVVYKDKIVLHSIIHDISLRKKAEKNLKLNSDRLESLVNIYNYKSNNVQDLLDYALNEAISITSSKIGYIYFYDESKQEFILNSWSKEVMNECRVVNPQTCYELDKTGIWGEAVRQGKDIIMNDFQAYDALKKGYPEGHVKLEKYLTIPIFDNNEIVAVVGVANKDNNYDETDILQLKLLMNSVWRIVKRQEAEEKTKLLTRAVEQSPVSITITSSDGAIQYINPVGVLNSGYDESELIGNNPRILKSGNHSKEFYKALWQTIKSGNDWNGEIYNRRKNGTYYWVKCLISPIFNDNNEIIHYIAVKEDITEKKERIEEIIKAKEKAEESDRLKTYFLGNLSHELRTPMNGILGFSKLLKDSDSLEDVAEISGIINISAARLLDTMNNLIELSRLEAGDFELKNELIMPASEVNDAISKNYTEAKSKGIEILFDNQVYVFECEIIAVAFRNICNNLVSNAVKFTNEGSVQITLSITKETNYDTLILEVKDTGIGINESQMENIFVRFRQGDEGLSRGYEGLGLGLALTKKYVDILNGYIFVESRVNFGSTFKVIIPIIDKSKNNYDDLKIIEHFNKNIKKMSNKKSLLLVEDNSITIKLVEQLLQHSINVVSAINREDAILQVKNHKFDIILMDIHLGGSMDGFEIASEIRQINEYSTIPIIALTAFSNDGENKRKIDALMNGCITKPFSKKDLLDSIRKFTEI
ncbi:MAG: PAS domain S-box protein [Candidatus Kapabacteria bacterium]|nr:PAS domain S-box protein [Ignavibacteriota bacterium]MCW5884669.1 PAS domain S-box protein [Candidatus Kapabacteria bacterium]